MLVPVEIYCLRRNRRPNAALQNKNTAGASQGHLHSRTLAAHPPGPKDQARNCPWSARLPVPVLTRFRSRVEDALMRSLLEEGQYNLPLKLFAARQLCDEIIDLIGEARPEGNTGTDHVLR